MAILNSLINTGVSRLLGKVYMNDLDVQGPLYIGSNTAANALIYLNNKLAIQGKDGWVRINEKVNGTQPFTSGVYFGNSIVETDNMFRVGGGNGMVALSTTAATFNVPTNITKATTISSTLNVTGATTLSSTLGVTGATTLTSATIDSATVNDINVYGELRAAKYSIETVQNLGGHFLVCPTIEVPSQGNESSFSCQVTRPSDTSDKLTIVFTDNSLSTDTFEGTKWAANSKVKVTGMINNIALGTCNGTISNWSTANKRVEISITCGTAISSKFSTSATSYTSAQVSDLSIMMYEVYTNNTTYPIGVYLTAYGKNKYSYIDIYGGTSDKPTTRMGKLDGLDKVNGTSPTGWGFYSAQNGYFQGTIVSSAGKIGGFTIGEDAIYSSTNALGTTANNVYVGTEGISLGTTFKVTKAGALTATSGKIANWRIEGTYLATGTATAPAANTLILSPAGTSSSYTVAGKAKTGWMITAGTTFGVNKDGGIYATSGNIGNWTIGTNELHTGTWGSDNSAMLCTGTSSSKEIGGSDSINGWVFTAGANFGVTKTGALYANSAHISGEITATSGTIGGCSIINGSLSVPAANITGTLSADRIGANTLTIGKFTTDDQDKILNDNLEIGGRNLLLDTELMTSFYKGSRTTLSDGVMTLNGSSTDWSAVMHTKKYDASLYDGSTFVLSFEYKTSANCATNITAAGSSTGVDSTSWTRTKYMTWTNMTLPNSGDIWKKYILTRTISISDLTSGSGDVISGYIQFYARTNNVALNIRHIKLEKGNKATDWTPAPEDIEVFAEETRSIAEDAANASESLNEDIYGEPFYQYTTNGVTYDVWKAEDGKYYYDDGSGTDKEVAASALDQDSDGYIIVRHGGLQDSVEKIAGSVLVDSAEPSVTIQAKHIDDTDERTAGIKITDERVSFKKNGEEVAYIDSNEDEGVIDINNARIHVTLRIGQLEIFDHDGGIGIRRYD